MHTYIKSKLTKNECSLMELAYGSNCPEKVQNLYLVAGKHSPKLPIEVTNYCSFM